MWESGVRISRSTFDGQDVVQVKVQGPEPDLPEILVCTIIGGEVVFLTTKDNIRRQGGKALDVSRSTYGNDARGAGLDMGSA